MIKEITNKIVLITALIISIFVSIIVASPSLFAQVDPLEKACSGNAASSSVCQPTTDNPIFGPDGVLTGAISIVSIIVGVAAVIMIIVSGLRFVLGGSNPETVASAKNSIIFAFVGLVVALSAQLIVIFVLRNL
jgi:hypothetical protein